jgi:hypothetical protein
MLTPDLQRPFPDYVTCPHCTEPEVEVWCYASSGQCHACGQSFERALPAECADHCDPTQCEAGPPPSTHFQPAERLNDA